MIVMKGNGFRNARNPKVRATINAILAVLRTQFAGLDGKSATSSVPRHPRWCRPVNRDSGQQRGHRTIAGGRTGLRNALFKATLVAVHYNTVLKAHYTALVGLWPPQEGRPHRLHFEKG